MINFFGILASLKLTLQKSLSNSRLFPGFQGPDTLVCGTIRTWRRGSCLASLSLRDRTIRPRTFTQIGPPKVRLGEFRLV